MRRLHMPRQSTPKYFQTNVRMQLLTIRLDKTTAYVCSGPRAKEEDETADVFWCAHATHRIGLCDTGAILFESESSHPYVQDNRQLSAYS